MTSHGASSDDPGGHVRPNAHGRERPDELGALDRMLVSAVDANRLRLADRYWLEERIGEGSISAVWRAWDELLAQPVAVKVFGTSTGVEGALRIGLRNRMRQVARLSHPALVTVHDIAEARTPAGDTVSYVVMELLEGETLAARLTRGPLPWREATRVGAAIASALAVVHEAGAAHRDVRPSRIFLSDTGARLLGLGDDVARRPARTSWSGAAPPKGGAASARGATDSPYAAPEGRRPTRRTGPADVAAADIYSVGAVLTEMLTGRPDRDAALPREVPGEVADLRLRCLAHDRSVRPSAVEVAEILRSAPTRARRAVRHRSFARPFTSPAGPAPAGNQTPTDPRPLRMSGHSALSLVVLTQAVGARAVGGRRGVVVGITTAVALGLVVASGAMDSRSAEGPFVAAVQPSMTAPGVPWLAPRPEPSPGTSGPVGETSAAPEPDRTAPVVPDPARSGPAPTHDAGPSGPQPPSHWPPGGSDRPGRTGQPGQEQTLHTLSSFQQAVDQGVTAREIRSDVGLDLNNVTAGLRNDVAAGRVTDPRPRAREIQKKINTRLGERGLTWRQADRLTSILSGITGYPPVDGADDGEWDDGEWDDGRRDRRGHRSHRGHRDDRSDQSRDDRYNRYGYYDRTVY